MIFYTNLFIPSRFAGITFGPFIFIRPNRRDDVGLLEHEKVHVKQFYRNPFFGLWYYFSEKSRFQYEAEAYREQLKWCRDDSRYIFANYLVQKYDLNITYQQALDALK